jgi:hypothetical protein
LGWKAERDLLEMMKEAWCLQSLNPQGNLASGFHAGVLLVLLNQLICRFHFSNAKPVEQAAPETFIVVSFH